jgi:hypothetical protein
MSSMIMIKFYNCLSNNKTTILIKIIIFIKTIMFISTTNKIMSKEYYKKFLSTKFLTDRIISNQMIKEARKLMEELYKINN